MWSLSPAKTVGPCIFAEGRPSNWARVLWRDILWKSESFRSFVFITTFSMEHIEIGFSGRLLVHNTELDDQLTIQQGKKFHRWKHKKPGPATNGLFLFMKSYINQWVQRFQNFSKLVDWQKEEHQHNDPTSCLNLYFTSFIHLCPQFDCQFTINCVSRSILSAFGVSRLLKRISISFLQNSQRPLLNSNFEPE